ncbi:hypothetical protein HPB49_005512 [Dermacentor silvarum]|uniref:Uncharacterized protein n=1 Tax=Dermacentor silvarum TaxID=543639 RepID=A0ACB8CVJ5_DERSI|nr:hypothetical protein HPB49_005512 [Dermacentor silvarum]
MRPRGGDVCKVKVPKEIETELLVDPIPINIHPIHNKGRMDARAKCILGKRYQQQSTSLFVDATSYGSGNRNAIAVVDEKGGHGLKYFLKYWSGNEKCGILKLRRSGKDHYEVHVWNSKVEDENSECTKKYNELRGESPSYDVYSHSCKSGDSTN